MFLCSAGGLWAGAEHPFFGICLAVAIGVSLRAVCSGGVIGIELFFYFPSIGQGVAVGVGVERIGAGDGAFDKIRNGIAVGIALTWGSHQGGEAIWGAIGIGIGVAVGGIGRGGVDAVEQAIVVGVWGDGGGGCFGGVGEAIGVAIGDFWQGEPGVFLGVGQAVGIGIVAGGGGGADGQAAAFPPIGQAIGIAIDLWQAAVGGEGIFGIAP